MRDFFVLLFSLVYQGGCGALLALPQPGVVFLLSGILLLPHPPQQLGVSSGPLPVSPAGLSVPLPPPVLAPGLRVRCDESPGTEVRVILIRMGAGVRNVVILGASAPRDTEVKRLE